MVRVFEGGVQPRGRSLLPIFERRVTQENLRSGVAEVLAPSSQAGDQLISSHNEHIFPPLT